MDLDHLVCEEQFKALVGKRVEVSGTQKKAKIAANGQPTGGTDPMRGDLKLFEVEVSTVKEAAVATAGSPTDRDASETPPETAPPPAATTAPPTPPAATTAPPPPPAPEPAPTATTGQAPAPQPQARELPRTASPLPLYELTSLLSFVGDGVRRLRRK